jgi:hypothetical protein
VGRKGKNLKWLIYKSLPLLLLVLIFFLSPASINAQVKPGKEHNAPKTHSVRKAALFSTALPGLGQAYNKKYWKIPIIYAGFGVLGYLVYSNRAEFIKYRDAYIYVANGDTTPYDNPYINFNETQLKSGMDYYRRNRDLTSIITGLWYILNILEAYVDAHFFDYDISDDLSMRLSPGMLNDPFKPVSVKPGMTLTFKF